VNVLAPAALGRSTWLDRTAWAVAALALLPVLSLALTAVVGRGEPLPLVSVAAAAL
jgi:hypothetical protein